MALSNQDLEQVGAYVQTHLLEWLPKNIIDLSERIARVEQRLDDQYDLIKHGFDRMDKRFEEVREDMNKRFEQVDKRFEQIDKRFEQSDKRFDDMHRHSNRWMTVLTLILGLMTIAMTVTNVIG